MMTRKSVFLLTFLLICKLCEAQQSRLTNVFYDEKRLKKAEQYLIKYKGSENIENIDASLKDTLGINKNVDSIISNQGIVSFYLKKYDADNNVVFEVEKRNGTLYGTMFNINITQANTYYNSKGQIIKKELFQKVKGKNEKTLLVFFNDSLVVKEQFYIDSSLVEQYTYYVNKRIKEHVKFVKGKTVLYELYRDTGEIKQLRFEDLKGESMEIKKDGRKILFESTQKKITYE